jgi:hypothetical protein
MSRATVSPGTCGDAPSVPTTTPRSGFPPRDFVPRSLHNGNALLSHIVTSCREMLGYGAGHDLAMTHRPRHACGPVARSATRMVDGSPRAQISPSRAGYATAAVSTQRGRLTTACRQQHPRCCTAALRQNSPVRPHARTSVRRSSPSSPAQTETGSVGRPPEQLLDAPALALGRTARAAVPDSHRDSLLAGRRGRAVVDVARGGSRRANTPDDDLLHDHDAFTSLAAQPHLITGPHGMRGLNPDPVDPDVPGPAGNRRSRTGPGQPHRPDPAVHPPSLITCHPATVIRYVPRGCDQPGAFRQGLAIGRRRGQVRKEFRTTPEGTLTSKAQHRQGPSHTSYDLVQGRRSGRRSSSRSNRCQTYAEVPCSRCGCRSASSGSWR